MAKNNEFWELYRHPLWQKKRLEVLNAANWKCQSCTSKDVTLNVHHTFYRKGAKPWEYENSELKCLCEDCHEYHHEMINDIKRHLGKLDDHRLHETSGYIKAQWLHQEWMSQRFPSVSVNEFELFGLLKWMELPTVFGHDGNLFNCHQFLCDAQLEGEQTTYQMMLDAEEYWHANKPGATS